MALKDKYYRRFKMTSIKEIDYKHSNARGNGPAKRMEGGDQTDDIEINEPNTPIKQKVKKEKDAQDTDKDKIAYKKPE
jgi:hypothetical protein